MRVTITQDEYDALISILDQVTTDYESATDEDYLIKTEREINLVDSIIQKYRKERHKANEFLSVRAYVSEKKQKQMFA